MSALPVSTVSSTSKVPVLLESYNAQAGTHAGLNNIPETSLDPRCSKGALKVEKFMS